MGQALHHQLGQPGDVLARNPGREHQAHRLGRQPPGREPQRLRGGVVQPLLVIYHADQRPFPRRLRQQAHDGQADQEPVRRRTGAEAKRGPEGLTLGNRKNLCLIQHRSAQLMQAGEGQLHFRLHGHGPRDQAPRGPPGQVVQQHRLAYAGLTAHHQGASLTGPHAGDEPIKYPTFDEPVR